MLAAAATTVADERVVKLLSSPRVQPADLVELIAEASGADEHGRNFLSTLAQNRRLGVLPEVAAIYEELRAEVENVADVHVTSAVQLDEAQRTRLAAALKKRLKREVRLHCAVDAGADRRRDRARRRLRHRRLAQGAARAARRRRSCIERRSG